VKLDQTLSFAFYQNVIMSSVFVEYYGTCNVTNITMEKCFQPLVIWKPPPTYSN